MDILHARAFGLIIAVMLCVGSLGGSMKLLEIAATDSAVPTRFA